MEDDLHKVVKTYHGKDVYHDLDNGAYIREVGDGTAHDVKTGQAYENVQQPMDDDEDIFVDCGWKMIQ